MENLSTRDLQVFREKSRSFYGSFKIPLEKLRHENLPENPRQFDEKNVERLVNVFKKEGCQRREAENHVPALISRPEISSVPPRAEEDLPSYNPSNPLVFLHGRHRLEAAQRFLREQDRWWVVDLYIDGLLT